MAIIHELTALKRSEWVILSLKLRALTEELKFQGKLQTQCAPVTAQSTPSLTYMYRHYLQGFDDKLLVIQNTVYKSSSV